MAAGPFACLHRIVDHFWQKAPSEGGWLLL